MFITYNMFKNNHIESGKMEKCECLLGIDLGTTYLKACVFERYTGRVAVQDGVRLPVRVLANGGREQDVPAILKVLKLMARKLQKAQPGAWSQIAGIGVASQGGSSIITTREGTPCTPMLLERCTCAGSLRGCVETSARVVLEEICAAPGARARDGANHLVTEESP